MDTIIKYCKGKKVYTIGVIMLVVWICEILLKIDIPNIEIQDPSQWLVLALGMLAGRAAIAKVNGK